MEPPTYEIWKLLSRKAKVKILAIIIFDLSYQILSIGYIRLALIQCVLLLSIMAALPPANQLPKMAVPAMWATAFTVSLIVESGRMILATCKIQQADHS